MKAQVKLNSHIYPESAVQLAIKDYLKIVPFSIIKKAAYYQITISKKACFSDNETILKEFANHVLGLTKKCH